MGPPLFAQSLNIDLGTSTAVPGPPSSSYGAAANQAGVWSRVGLGTTPALPDLTGAATTVSVAVTADSDQGAAATCTGDLGALVNDFVYSTASWNVALTGLTNGNYTLYLYEPEDESVTTGAMTVNGAPLPGLTGHTCVLTAGVMYTTTSVTVSSGTLTIAGTGSEWVGLAGLQLVTGQPSGIPAASPATLLLIAVMIGAVGFMLLRRGLRA
jgi:hypothetical protein